MSDDDPLSSTNVSSEGSDSSSGLIICKLNSPDEEEVDVLVGLGAVAFGCQRFLGGGCKFLISCLASQTSSSALPTVFMTPKPSAGSI